MSDDSLAARAPSGTHDVLSPESARWEAVLAGFAAQVEAAGYGLAHTPIFEDVKVFRRGIGEASEVVGKEMYEFEDRGGRALALRPEGTAPMVRAFVQHRPPLPWKAWYATPAFRYERPQAGRYRQHHQVGVEALGPERPRPRRRGGVPGRRVLPLPRPGRLRPPAQLDGRRGVPAGLPGPAGRVPGRAAGPAVPRAPGTPGGQSRSGSSTASATPAGPPPRTPRPWSTTSATRAAPTSNGWWPVSTPSGWATGSTTAWSGVSTTTPGPPSSSPRTALESAQNGIGGGGRYDGLVEMLGGPPTPGIGFGIGIERLLLACDAEGVFAVAPDPARRLRGGRGRRARRPGTSPPSCAGPGCGPTGPSTAGPSSPR